MAAAPFKPSSSSPNLLLNFLLIILFLFAAEPSVAASSPTELQLLLQLKHDWGEPQSLSEWSTATAHCNWTGIKCDNQSVVTGVILPSYNLTGIVPSYICGLTGLSSLLLSNNNLIGSFPQLANCSNLRQLDLSLNLFTGDLPSDFTTASLPSGTVTNLTLSGNNFSGPIPHGIGHLSTLSALLLDNNLFTGRIPSEIGNLTQLQQLTLANNPFGPSPIPPEFGKLTKLRLLWMAQCNLVGDIPSALTSLSELAQLDLSMNSLAGTIPPAIWNLTGLKFLYLYNNSLNGTVADGSIGAYELEQIDVSYNNLAGEIPTGFGNLRKLSLLFMSGNQLSSEIPPSIGKLPSLTHLRLFNNKLSGAIPPELGKFSPLVNVELDENLLTGPLPAGLCAGGALIDIVVYNNNLSGEIPPELGNCPTLSFVEIENNNFSGMLPPGWLAANSSVWMAFMANNQIAGTLPAALPWNLTRLDVGNNRFSGNLPSSAPRLTVFSADGNLFSGEIPADIGSAMPELQTLNLSGNELAGAIPASISALQSLNVLDLGRNLISGEIPSAIGAMPVLTWLNLAGNRLSGEIPPELGDRPLSFLNLSDNAFSGQIPALLESPAYGDSFAGNPNLCSSGVAITGVNRCGASAGGGGGLSSGVLAALAVAGVALLVVGGALACLLIRENKWRTNRSDAATWKMIPFAPLDFTESAVVRGLTEANAVGSGGSSRVYRVTVNGGGRVLAVKKIWGSGFNVQSSKSFSHLRDKQQFDAEVKILGSIRHVNIIRLLCCISSAESNLLVYDYMENGSLDKWLHAAAGSGHPLLDWPARFRVAVDAACGLSYMHHECVPALVHRDIKSSNILIDSEFRAQIADFGLARVMSETVTSKVVGSVGYMAPELPYLKKLNEKADVYSFGVVLLELTTGREASDGDGNGNLAEWAWRHFHSGESIGDAIDKRIDSSVHADMIEVMFKLGVICTGTRPSTRPTMKEVLQVLMRCDQMLRKGQSDVVTVADGDDNAPLLRMQMQVQGSRRSTDAHDEDEHSKISNYYGV